MYDHAWSAMFIERQNSCMSCIKSDVWSRIKSDSMGNVLTLYFYGFNKFPKVKTLIDKERDIIF